MKASRTLMMVVVALTLGVAASAQSLAEVAKKEKKRRETNKESAKRVITDRELTYGYGGEPSTSSTVTVPGGEGQEGEDQGEASEGAEGSGEQDETKSQAYWQERVTAAKTKIAGIEKQIQDGDWGEGLRQGVDPRGQNNLNQRQQLEQQLAVARAELASIQAEGRRAGVPPGWLR